MLPFKYNLTQTKPTRWLVWEDTALELCRVHVFQNRFRTWAFRVEDRREGSFGESRAWGASVNLKATVDMALSELHKVLARITGRDNVELHVSGMHQLDGTPTLRLEKGEVLREKHYDGFPWPIFQEHDWRLHVISSTGILVHSWADKGRFQEVMANAVEKASALVGNSFRVVQA